MRPMVSRYDDAGTCSRRVQFGAYSAAGEESRRHNRRIETTRRDCAAITLDLREQQSIDATVNEVTDRFGASDVCLTIVRKTRAARS